MYTLNNSTTGQTPAQFLGPDFGGRDDYNHRDWAFSGCIDAPWHLPAGGLANDNCDNSPVGQYTIR